MTEPRKGELYALILSLLESLFPIMALFGIVHIGALNMYAGVIIIATAILIVVLKLKEGWKQLLHPQAQKDLLLTSFFITTLFALIFIGLQHTTAGNMAVILFLQLLFSYLYFHVIGNDPVSTGHTVGAFLMGVGAIVILYPENFALNPGDWFILAAAAIAPIANLYQKRARRYVGSLTILTYRNLVAIPFLLVAAWFFEGVAGPDAYYKALPWMILTATLVYVIAKIFWIESLHRIGVTKLSAMIAFIPVFTLIFAYLFLGEVPTLQKAFGIIPIFIGGFLMTRSE